LLLSLTGLWPATLASADTVFAGIDLLATEAGTASTTLNIPAGFFDPGSEPFSDTVNLGGKPLDQSSGHRIGKTDQALAPPAPSCSVPPQRW